MDVINFASHDDAINSVVETLRDFLVPDTDIQRKVQQKIGVMQGDPHFANYLLHILKNSEVFEEHIRSVSAIILKNSISVNAPSQDFLNIIRQECLNLIADSSKDVRSSVTTLISTLLCMDISTWPNLIPQLYNLIDSSDGQVSDSAMMTLFKVCEELFANKDKYKDILYMVLTKFIVLTTSDRYNIRLNALRLINQAMDVTKVADSNLYLNNLFAIIKDDRAEIQKLICQGFRLFIEHQEECIMPHIYTVVEYMVFKTECDDKDVALQACEFWLTITKLPNHREYIGASLERLLPTLLNNMKYSTYELCAIQDLIGADDEVDDKAEDICPFGMRGDNNSESGYNNDHNDGYVGWTLRKCSAASLDAISVQCGSDVLRYFLPLMNEALSSSDDLVKESGILALGAIADGCMEGLDQYLPDLLPYLLRCIESENSLIRVITCWTISRYTPWFMELQATHSFFVPVMTALLTHFLDRNKRVQRAALSAFCIFQEEAQHKLIPYIDFILQAFSNCFKRLKFRSYLLLYDAIGVLAQSVGNALNKPQYIECLMPALIAQFNANENYYDEHFMALVECLSNTVIALEVGFLPFTEVIYNRCLVIINETVNAIQWYMENPYEFDNPDRDPLCVAHDMLLGMAIGLKTYFVKFVTNSNLVQNLFYTIQDDAVYVRQPALALYGELVQLCFSHLSPTVHNYIPFIIENIDKNYDIACNNAAWVIGKLCIAIGDKIEPYAQKIMQKFLDIILSMDGTKTMYQTVAISICTLGLVCPEHVSLHLSSIIRPCCHAMRNVGDCEEKDVGFRGLCSLIQCNPTAALNDFIYFCDAIASWNDGIRPDLKDTIKNILHGFQVQLGPENWAQIHEQFPSMLKVRLERLYGM